MTCPSCGADNVAGSKFCSDCGAPMALACTGCATPLRPGAKFCNECGKPVSGRTGAKSSPIQDVAPHAHEGPSAERRLVSVLFADLVGFTTLAEHRDAEEVRELLTRYFETCRALVTRYGGTVEKFIGDAVMAVWGAPIAHEDDAERAVRAALDLVDAVAALGSEIGASGLQARAGVLTGAAAVTLGDDNQGMVAGDLVNTASRIQAEAQPGAVLVGAATRQASEAALEYEDTGDHVLKGKTEPVRLWRALRVVAGRRGALKPEGLEPPFVGRDRELRLIKDLFHASAEEHKAHLVSVAGIAGIGKSRLSWEFFKYIDGLADVVHWHRGRCLAYGEGVTYWALAEMVRMRADIVEGEDTASARRKLQACLAEHLRDEEERRWVEPRLAHLLALEEHATQSREDLFSAWRLFFERLAETQPTILLFEDMQWADTSLLEFIEYLLDWSRNHALYVVTSARPELIDRHPTWGAGKRNFTSVFLEPLAAAAMEQLLDGLVPGLPEGLREQILERSEGVPLYAVETVRMLLDRGLLARAGSIYRLTGPVEDLAIPPSLHGLIAARLDGLRPEARRVLQDAAVLGKAFTLPALSAVSGLADEELEPLLMELVRKEVVSVQADPRSPERGQYGFLQDLVKRVAYQTLSKRDRKLRHLAVAAWFERGEESDVVEVVASHYLEAYNLAPQDPDASIVKQRAADVLVQAGEREASLAANSEAERYFEQAAKLVSEPTRQAELHERAGHVAWRAGRADAAIVHYGEAIALFEELGMAHAAARGSAYIGRIQASRGQIEVAVKRLEQAFAVLAGDVLDADVATVAEALGSLYFFTGDAEKASARVETALEIAEALWLPEVLSRALNTKAVLAQSAKHPEEALGLLTHALKIGLDQNIPSAAGRAYANLSDALVRRDRYGDALEGHRNSLALARKVGDRVDERSALGEMSFVLMLTGEWDEALSVASTITDDEMRDAANEIASIAQTVTEIGVNRGDLGGPERVLSVFERFATSGDTQERAIYAVTRASWLRAIGNNQEALAAAKESLAAIDRFGPGHQAVRAGLVESVEAAFALGDLEEVAALLARVERLRPGELPPSMRAQTARFRARLGVATGDDDGVDSLFTTATAVFREIGALFWVAVTLLEHAEWLSRSARPAEAEKLATEAAGIFTRLGATPWLERARRCNLAEAVAS